jgi:peptidoglycan/xylan/chitin deacetylase (PgdA/CDA1 family)
MVNNNLRQALKNSYISLFSPFNKINNELYFLYGHYISRESADLNKAFDLLVQLKKKVAFLDFEEACEMIRQNKQVKYPAVCFSFDDGFEEIVNGVAPIIKDLGANTCIFVNPGFIDACEVKQKEMCSKNYHVNKKPATWNDLSKFISNGGVVGSHTLDHVNLSSISNDASISQIINSKLVIESKLNVECKYFAWPYGTAKDITSENILTAIENYDLVFSAIRSNDRFHKFNKVINREHFELDWPLKHVKHFLSRKKDLIYNVYK